MRGYLGVCFQPRRRRWQRCVTCVTYITLTVSRVGMKTYPLIPPIPPFQVSSAEKEEQRGGPKGQCGTVETEFCGRELARNVHLSKGPPWAGFPP